MTKILKSDNICYVYTGVPTVKMLNFIFSWVNDAAATVKTWQGKNRLVPGKVKGAGRKQHKVTNFECMIIAFVRIGKGLDIKHLSFLFGISPSHVSRIFTTWINILYQCMKRLIVWPSKDLCSKNLPESFQSFPRTRVIIDCTELKVAKTFRPAAQRATWSSYKHTNTFARSWWAYFPQEQSHTYLMHMLVLFQTKKL